MKWVWLALGVLLALVLVMALAGAGFAWWSVQRSWPQVEGSLALPGLGDQVEVLRDERGVPNIYANTAADLFFAHGFVHAQDRFWEMDVRRHITAGRLSEMLGEETAEADAFARTLGWRDVAERELPLLSQEARDILLAYTDGVNAYLRGKRAADVSLEYQLLALQNSTYAIESWDPIDSLSWLKALAWQLSANIEAEVQRALGAAAVGAERIEQLFPPYPQARNGTILSNADLRAAGLPTGGAEPPAEAAAALAPAAAEAVRSAAQNAALLDGVLAPGGQGIGSNSWVVGGERTTSGKPMLANDPHLAASMPSLWYQVGLHCRTVDAACPYDVSGWTMAGLPGIVIGHNDRIAWGLTNLGPDVTDLVLEQVDAEAALVDGSPVPMGTRTEVIRVAGGEDRQITVRTTRHGPIISALPGFEEYGSVGEQAPVPAPGQARSGTAPQRGDGYAVALRWTGLDPSPTYDALVLLNRARNWGDFRAAARLLTVPSQNLIYADVDGNIGYQAPGRIPVRIGYDGTWPVPGWDSRYDWERFIPFDQMPRSLNPGAGVITSANQRVVPGGYPWPLQSDEYSFGARAKRINARLADAAGAGPVTAVQMAEIQMDAGSDIADFLVPELAVVEGLDEIAASGVAALGDWDLQQTAGSGPAAFFNVFYRQLVDRMFIDELPDIELADAAGDRFWEVIRALWETPQDPWWDDVRTPQAEDRDRTVVDALNAAGAELADRQGDDPADWRWGDLHTLTFTHQTLGSSDSWLLQRIFNRGPEPTGGGNSVPLANSWIPAEGYEVVWVPSMRHVVDLDDFDASTWVNLTGNSGHAYHDRYGDQIDAWRRGEQYAWPFTREAVKAASGHRLVLSPG